MNQKDKIKNLIKYHVKFPKLNHFGVALGFSVDNAVLLRIAKKEKCHQNFKLNTHYYRVKWVPIDYDKNNDYDGISLFLKKLKKIDSFINKTPKIFRYVVKKIIIYFYFSI